VRAANEALRRDLYAQRAVVAQLQSALQAKLAHVPEGQAIQSKPITSDRSNVVDDSCAIVEPMDSGEERPSASYTPPLPPVKKAESPEPFDNGDVKPLSVKEEKKMSPVEKGDHKEETDLDQKDPQTLYKKKKIPRNMR
jgi:hypothetical protein